MQPTREMSSDWDLLREYIRSGSETAFETLVQRHLGLVYSVAFRECGDHGLAEEIVNNVFLLLAQKAASLKREIVLAGWLFKTARYTTSNLSSHRQRRLMWEREAACIEAGAGEGSSTSEVSRAWEIVADQLDAAVGELNEVDRNAILLRFYEKKSLRDVGMNFGISEEAARKRTARALEKLRGVLSRRGITASVGTLGLALAAYPSQEAPSEASLRIAERATGVWEPKVAVFGQVSLKYLKTEMVFAFAAIAVVGLLGIQLFGLAFSSTTLSPRDVFVRMTRAMNDGDGKAYSETILFRTDEERAAQPVIEDSIRAQQILQKALLDRFGADAFTGSRFPASLDRFDTNRFRTLPEMIEGRQATVALPWGTKLPFVWSDGQWKMDFFAVRRVSSVREFSSLTATRSAMLLAMAEAVKSGQFSNVAEAFDAYLQRTRGNQGTPANQPGGSDPSGPELPLTKSR